MIYLFAGVDNSKDRLPIDYGDIRLNDESVNRLTEALYECNVVAISESWDAVTEPRQTTHGMESYEPRKVSATIRIDGIIRAPSLAILMDAVMLLNATFDPVNAFHNDDDPTNVPSVPKTNRATYQSFSQGYMPLSFSIPTADTTTYATGLIPAFYNVRSIQKPVSRTSQFEGLTCSFTLLLHAADPRCYYNYHTLTGERTNVGALPVTTNSLALFPSWPVFILTFSGSGSGQFSISRAGTGGGAEPLVSVAAGPTIFDATGYVNTDVMRIDMERHTVKKNGVIDMADYVSGPWQDFPPDDITWTLANVTGTLAAHVRVRWYRALS